MTEFWKSNPNYWCDVCRVWMQDNKIARLNHERGIGHQTNLKNKLKQMAKTQKDEKRQADASERLMTTLEEKARKQYELDQAAMQQALEAQSGRWVYNTDSGYYYNAIHRWYYDCSTKWYYGGEPVEWTQSPTLPDHAKFENAPKEGGPYVEEAAGSNSKSSGTSQPAAGVTSQPASTAPSTAKQQTSAPAPSSSGLLPVVGKHPLQDIGGYQMPSTGKIGGAKGLGTTQAAAGDKRKRDESKTASKKPVTKEEEEALARREAARQRVQQRTMHAFGLS